MGIKTVTDPVSGQDITMAEGVVAGVYFNKPPDKIKNNPKMSWATTSILIKVGTDYINLGFAEEKKLRCKDLQGNYHDVVKGMEIGAVIENVSKNGQYTNYSTPPKNVTIRKMASASAPQQSSGGSSGGYVKDDSGIDSGASLNAAGALLNYKYKDDNELLKYAGKILGLIRDLRKIQAEALGKSENDYEVKASVGQAVNFACHKLDKKTAKNLREEALNILTNVSPKMVAFVKTGSFEVEEPTPEPEPQPEPQGDADFDDDIPF